jgi:hypothetical protein
LTRAESKKGKTKKRADDNNNSSNNNNNDNDDDVASGGDGGGIDALVTLLAGRVLGGSPVNDTLAKQVNDVHVYLLASFDRLA